MAPGWPKMAQDAEKRHSSFSAMRLRSYYKGTVVLSTGYAKMAQDTRRVGVASVWIGSRPSAKIAPRPAKIAPRRVKTRQDAPRRLQDASTKGTRWAHELGHPLLAHGLKPGRRYPMGP